MTHVTAVWNYPTLSLKGLYELPYLCNSVNPSVFPHKLRAYVALPAIKRARPRLCLLFETLFLWKKKHIQESILSPYHKYLCQTCSILRPGVLFPTFLWIPLNIFFFFAPQQPVLSCLATNVICTCQCGYAWSAKVFGQMVCVNLHGSQDPARPSRVLQREKKKKEEEEKSYSFKLFRRFILGSIYQHIQYIKRTLFWKPMGNSFQSANWHYLL